MRVDRHPWGEPRNRKGRHVSPAERLAVVLLYWFRVGVVQPLARFVLALFSLVPDRVQSFAPGRDPVHTRSGPGISPHQGPDPEIDQQFEPFPRMTCLFFPHFSGPSSTVETPTHPLDREGR